MKSFMVLVHPRHPNHALAILALLLTAAMVLAALWCVRTTPLTASLRIFIVAAALGAAFLVRKSLVGPVLTLSRAPEGSHWRLSCGEIDGVLTAFGARDGGIDVVVDDRQFRIAPPQFHATVVSMIERLLRDRTAPGTFVGPPELDPDHVLIGVHDSPKATLVQVRGRRSMQRPFLLITAVSIVAIGVLVWLT